MIEQSSPPAYPPSVLSLHDLPALFQALHDSGYLVIGPRLSSNAIIYDELDTPDALPYGWCDSQSPGSYRLYKTDGHHVFGYTAGAQSWKRFLFLPKRRLWHATVEGGALTIPRVEEEIPKLAFLGVRACELRAISIQDHVFLPSDRANQDYAARRAAALLIAVNCGRAGDTCFCVSMDAGPRAKSGFDLALTEIVDDVGHEFLVEVGTQKGQTIAKCLPMRLATDLDIASADAITTQVASSMGRTVDTSDLKELLQNSPEHPHWTEIASRCLGCANCTFVCPTCFCHSIEDVTDIECHNAERIQRWDSCFTTDYSNLVGGAVRSGIHARYRQWLTHKLANWIDQFGESGCVGCGRCITWCPAGIDFTEEIDMFRAILPGR
ncbi:MAG: 4Fe-4S dicluster domain-containing protein [Alphaproteobacteria bacterium]|nr:4Fe-4S dicluster domain-containing protein [Alphaproteobacteria bacterium]